MQIFENKNSEEKEKITHSSKKFIESNDTLIKKT